MTTWRELAQGLADEIAAAGVPHTPAWRDALEAIPRHVFVRGSEAVFSTSDGSWAAVALKPDGTGEREVRQGGPVRILDVFEAAQGMWDELGRPNWDRLGLTVTPDGRHRVWLDQPDDGIGWDLY